MGITLAAAATAPETTATSFAEVYRATFADVYAYVATIVRDRTAAEDVTAQAYERAYKKRRSFDAARGNERAWIFGIARNAALDELRRRKRQATLVAEPPDEVLVAHDEVAVRRATVRAALETLDARDRELIALKFHGGLTNAELAEVLGMSESNAGTRLHRAVTKLREACA
ncbi:MAG TPA: sigma-70 family RNA polymerase sigma factor [Solirubrobacteraceae bacterium]